MDFTNQDRTLTPEEIAEVEQKLGIRFPDSLRRFFLNHNGGDPDPYVYQDEGLHTVVPETLPLISGEERDTAVEVYEDLILSKRIADRRFFPLAVDAGGEYFFVDCQSPDAPALFFRSDSANPVLDDLGLTLEEFWDSLMPEQ